MNDDHKAIRRGRLKLLAVPGIFVLSFVAAWVAFQVGWQPAVHSHGKPILPQRNFTGIPIIMDNGSNWLWRDAQGPSMTLVALETGPCKRACVGALTFLRNARITLKDKQNRVRLLYIGQPPTGKAGRVLAKSWHYGHDVAGKLAGFRPPKNGEVSAVLVEANGTALVRYPAGFSPAGVKDDLHKVIR